jgi:Glycosyltransferase Family 4
MASIDIGGLRVALVCPYAVDVPGGVQGQMTALAARLRAAGAQVDVFAPGGRPRPGFVSLGEPQCFPDNGSVTRTVVTPWQLAPLVRLGAAYDVVHVHEPTATIRAITPACTRSSSAMPPRDSRARACERGPGGDDELVARRPLTRLGPGGEHLVAGCGESCGFRWRGVLAHGRMYLVPRYKSA